MLHPTRRFLTSPPPVYALLLQCRHINYESLEAFLCVECGYCAYAHFGFRLTAAMDSSIKSVSDEVRPVCALCKQTVVRCSGSSRPIRTDHRACCRGDCAMQWMSVLPSRR